MLTETQTNFFNSISSKCEQLTGIPITEIISNKRNKELVKARIAISIALLKYKWTLKNIGRCLGRDHSSVVHMRQVYSNYIFSFNQNGERDSVIELAETLTRFAEMNPYNLQTRASIMAKMVHNGSDLLAAVGLVI
jgi:hypothetical protein